MPFDEKNPVQDHHHAPLPRSPRTDRSERERTPQDTQLGTRLPGAMTSLQGSVGNAAMVQAVHDDRDQHRHTANCGHQGPVQRALAAVGARQQGPREQQGQHGTAATPHTLTVQRARYATGRTERDPDSDNYDSEGDNFDTRYQHNLTQPTPDATVEDLVNQGSSTYVVLWRGTSLAHANAMESAGSAGGATPNPNTQPPSRSASRHQVGHGSSLTEFTANTGVAESFGSQGAVVVVYISAAYLARGSRSEDGWTALSSAPVQVLDVVDRTRGRQQGRRVANAS